MGRRGEWRKVETKISPYKSSKRASRGIIATIQVQVHPHKRLIRQATLPRRRRPPSSAIARTRLARSLTLTHSRYKTWKGLCLELVTLVK